MSGAKAAFAPLPARAVGDKRLSGLHFRVLAAIAMHDRMSASRGKGQGCWAGNKTLAVECGCDYSRLSATITDLGRWGYVERQQHPLNKRLRVYRISYTDDDITFTKASNSLRDGKQSSGDAGQTVCEPAKSEDETVCRHFQESQRNQQGAEVNIFRETEKILGETFERDSAEAARPDERARCEGNKPLPIDAKLAMIERRLKEMREAPRPDDVLHLETLGEFLQFVADEYDGHTGNPTGGRALRLIEEIGWIMEGQP